jgi:hypothetical protein
MLLRVEANAGRGSMPATRVLALTFRNSRRLQLKTFLQMSSNAPVHLRWHLISLDPSSQVLKSNSKLYAFWLPICRFTASGIGGHPGT